MNDCVNCLRCVRERQDSKNRIIRKIKGPQWGYRCVSADPEAVFFDHSINFDKGFHDCRGFRKVVVEVVLNGLTKTDQSAT